jgi:phosphoribosylformimino-5-aminoimidazole carboxamide ribotide isomerase
MEHRMNIIPAIDLLDGEAVRLYQGNYQDVRSYSSHPAELALRFGEQGARYLHLVDLDAARYKSSDAGERRNNRDQIKAICRESSLEIEVGGGVRSDEDVKELIDLGVKRLIVGTLLVKNPDLVAGWAAKYPADFIAGIDARDGEVKISGWEDGSSVRDEDLAAAVARMGMKGIVYTNISRDGTLSGPDIERSLIIAEASGLPVTVSGGMGSMDDCRAVHRAAGGCAEGGTSPIHGVIIGKAIYEGAIDLEEAIMLYQEGSHENS